MYDPFHFYTEFGTKRSKLRGMGENSMKIVYFHNLVFKFHAEHRPKKNLNMVNLR